MKQAKKFITNNYTTFTLGILFVFALWAIISYSDGKGSFIFPSPKDTFVALGDLLGDKYTYESIGWSMLRTFVGFAIAFILALILGLFAGNFKKSQNFFKPLIIVLKCVPTAAFVFLFLAKAGSRWAPTFIVSLLAFPILFEAIVRGMNAISDDINDALKIDSQNNLYILFKIRLPLAFPYLALGIASSFALSVKTEIMAEIISGDTNYGLGCMISGLRNTSPEDLSPIFALAIIAVVIVLLISLIAHLLERHFGKDVMN